MSFALKAWNNLKGNVAGRWLFSRFVCFKAPYFASISPLFDPYVSMFCRGINGDKRLLLN